jgi:hypothetical protein
VALFLPREGASVFEEPTEFGNPTVTVDPPPQENKE